MNTALAPLANADPEALIAQYLNDPQSSITRLAESHKVTKQAMSLFLLKRAEELWKDAQVARALARKDDAENELDTAPSMLDLARAEKRLKAAQWDLERVCRRIYGQDAPPPGANAVQININLRGERATKQVDSDYPSAQVIDSTGPDKAI